MYTMSRKHQLALHSLSQIQLNSGNPSEIGMKVISRGVILNSLNLNFPQIKRHSDNFFQSRYPKKLALFAQLNSKMWSHKSQFQSHFHSTKKI